MHKFVVNDQVRLHVFIQHIPKERQTIVTAQQVANDQVIDSVSASATASLQDQWSRSLGRRIALGRACKKLGLPKAFRTAVVESFK